MNALPEQIVSGEAGSPGRPRCSAQFRMLTSKAEPKGGERERSRARKERVREKGAKAGPNSSKTSMTNTSVDMRSCKTE